MERPFHADNLSPMAAAKQHSRKVRQRGGKGIFRFVGGCFGISNKIAADHHGDGGGLVKHGKPTAVNDQETTSSGLIGEIDAAEVVVEAGGELVAEPAPKVIDNKKNDTISKKNKSSDKLGRAVSSIKQVDKQIRSCSQFNKSNWESPTTLSHSVSLPLPRSTNEKLTTSGMEMADDDGGRKGKMGKDTIVAGEIDSMLGALIIMVTLMVMLIWGKVCAILCTSAWFYSIPRLRANLNESSYVNKLKIGRNHVDFDSREYKKKVVLEGLLGRNQHTSSVKAL